MATFDEILETEKNALREDFTREDGKLLMRFPEVSGNLTFDLSLPVSAFRGISELDDEDIEGTFSVICRDFNHALIDGIPMYRLTRMLSAYMNRFKALQGVELGK